MRREVIIESNEDSHLMAHAEREMRLVGLFDKDSDYNGDIAECVMDLIAVMSSHGHSGGSATMTLEIFAIVSQYKPLSPITSDPDEWFRPLDEGNTPSGDPINPVPMWQSKRDPSLFSYDGGQTWNSVDDPRWHQTFSPRAWLWRRHWRKLQKAAGA